MCLDLYLENFGAEKTAEAEFIGRLVGESKTVFSTNITHNLNEMFMEAEVYEILWHGDGLIAGEVLPKLETALELMKSDPVRFEKFSASNGWGTYAQALPWLEKVIIAFRQHRSAFIRCCR